MAARSAKREQGVQDASGGIPSNLPGTTPGGYDPAYGGVPIIPDPIASAWQAIGGDQSMLPQLFSLGNAYNLWNFGQQQQELQGTPGYSNVTDLMAGRLPQDVQNRVAQTAAERAIGGGTVGSPNANAALLSAMGLTSLDAQKLGQSEYGNLAGLYPMAAPFNLSSFFVTPEQQQAANAAANVSAAAPNPAAAAAAEQKALMEAIAAGKGSVPPVGPAPTIPNIGGVSGSLATPSPAEQMVSGPAQTVNRGAISPSKTVADQIQQALQYGPNPMQGPAINPSTGAASGGYQGPAINPWTGTAAGGYQGPAINPWTGAASGGYQGPAIDPWTGMTDQWWNDPANLFPFEGDTGAAASATDWSYDPGSMTPASQSDWWNAPDPWAALTGTDWTQPAPDENAGNTYNAGDIPDWAYLPGEDYQP